jgi:methylmalonyl-CoA mutase
MRDPSTVFRSELELASDFPTPTIDEWQSLAEASLKGKALAKLSTPTPEGIVVKPLYTDEDAPDAAGYPGLPPFIRGSSSLGGWETCPRITDLEPAVAANQMREAVAQGARSCWLLFHRSCRVGLDVDDPRALNSGGDGILVLKVDDIEVLLEAGAPLPLHVDGGGATFALTALLLAAARRRQVPFDALRGSIWCDPLGALARDGELCLGLDRSVALLPELLRWTGSHALELQPVVVSTLPYHMAGATAVDELAFAIATGVEYLRALVDAGLDIETVLAQPGRFVIAMGRDLFMGVAKLRALRNMWSRVAQVCTASPDTPQPVIHAVTSPRSLTARDPWVNLLRGTVESFAAVVGGAGVITTETFDAAVGPSDPLSRRLALNTQTILREESHFDHVVDPAGGSWYVERLTAELARTAWSAFQEIETTGGMTRALAGNRVAARLADSLAAKRRAVASRRAPVTGVSTFPHLGEPALERERPNPQAAFARAARRLANLRGGPRPIVELDRIRGLAEASRHDGSLMEATIDAAAAGATIGELTAALAHGAQTSRIAPPVSEREGELFEALRDASDAWRAEHGWRPQVFLANVGPVSEHRPRAAFARSFFEAGGIEALDRGGFATAADAAAACAQCNVDMVVICSSDARYPEVVPQLAQALRKQGLGPVLVAGRPGDHEQAWRDAGVDHFIFTGCDAHGVLRSLLTATGVIR